VHARGLVTGQRGVIVLAHESYHEGVIGLAAARLVEEFYRPAIVISKKGDVAKASARSISGFNIIKTIRELEDLLLEGGGHPMAAGFSIESGKIEEFTKRINEISSGKLTDKILTKRLKIDLEINFENVDGNLLRVVKSFEPTGIGNPSPTFISRKVSLSDARVVGRDGTHLKLKLIQGGITFDAIAFGMGRLFQDLSPTSQVDIAYTLEENTFNGRSSLELKIKDLKLK
jgi:single-stranded-DNA-specific exonuclease